MQYVQCRLRQKFGPMDDFRVLVTYLPETGNNGKKVKPGCIVEVIGDNSEVTPWEVMSCDVTKTVDDSYFQKNRNARKHHLKSVQ